MSVINLSAFKLRKQLQEKLTRNRDPFPYNFSCNEKSFPERLNKILISLDKIEKIIKDMKHVHKRQLD